MAEKMALIPPNLLRHYQLSKSENHIEDDIDDLLNKNKLPDNMKVKLLSQLINKYHRVVHTPLKPLPVSLTKEDTYEDISEKTSESVKDDDNGYDYISQQIRLSVPYHNRQYISEIKSGLKRANYGWNALGELTLNDIPISGSHIADLFSYLMRDRKGDEIPIGFSEFWKGIQKAGIPKEFISRKFQKRKEHKVDSGRKSKRGEASTPDYFAEGKKAELESESQSKDLNVPWLTY